jgi:hypothetical protein
LKYRRQLLLIALSCRFSAQNLRNTTNKNNNIFPPEKRKRKTSKRRKKDMQVKQQCSGDCQGFLKKILPEAQRGVEIFL